MTRTCCEFIGLYRSRAMYVSRPLCRYVAMSDMYLPKVFAVEDLARLHDFMEQFNFATLVTQHNGQISASHIPFLLDRNTGAFGALRAHIAIRNPQLRDLQSGSPALVIFQGPHTYISPSW